MDSLLFGGFAAFLTASLLPAVILLVIGILVIRLILNLVQRLLDKSKLEKAAHSLLKSIVRVVLYILLLLMVAKRLGIDTTGVIALASVLTLAVSLSVQNALTNVIGGLTLLYTKPFKSGDYIEAAGKAGTVTEIGMTYTRLLTVDNKMVSIPNSSVVSSDIVNYSTTGTRRVDVAIKVNFGESSQKVMDALVQAGTIDKVLLDPAPAAMITAYEADGIAYELRTWVKSEDYWDVLFAMHANIRTIFEAQGIQIAYPHVHVYMEK